MCKSSINIDSQFLLLDVNIPFRWVPFSFFVTNKERKLLVGGKRVDEGRKSETIGSKVKNKGTQVEKI